ncbi:MAG: DNA translocase FtsK 4TM domain-containing protein, partial [Verrucomicrobia bacterium]|nr:DNA translocase FtsK 4TM domain-containing protein [Verrucomicrobiota bacterium]
MAKQEKHALTRELGGIIYLSASILLACSLFSYSAYDIPLFKSPPESNNWIGITGAYLGFGAFSLVGWAANLLPLAAAFLGFSALFRIHYRLQNSALWMLAFVLSMACLAQVVGWGNAAWKKTNLFGIGGLVGFYVGEQVFWRFLKHGAFIIFSASSLASIFMAAQLKPREIYEWVRNRSQRRKIQKREEALRNGDIKTVLRTREEEIAERKRLIERELERELARQGKRGRSSSEPQPESRGAGPVPAPAETPAGAAGAVKPPEPATSGPPDKAAGKPVSPEKPEKPEYKITRPGK